MHHRQTTATILTLLAASSSRASAFLVPIAPTLSSHKTTGTPAPFTALPASSEDETNAAIVVEQLTPQPSDAVENKISVPCPDCDLCDGSGRILGGIGTVLEWWPIKAYRPCPNFVERGGKYVRSGQGLDEIAFGRIAKE
ncbi:hypothetical protein ACHAW6_015346 [Cyclotella cf. meneghiniana]